MPGYSSRYILAMWRAVEDLAIDCANCLLEARIDPDRAEAIYSSRGADGIHAFRQSWGDKLIAYIAMTPRQRAKWKRDEFGVWPTTHMIVFLCGCVDYALDVYRFAEWGAENLPSPQQNGRAALASWLELYRHEGEAPESWDDLVWDWYNDRKAGSEGPSGHFVGP